MNEIALTTLRLFRPNCL